MEDDFIDNINYFYKKQDWKEILDLDVSPKNEIARSLLWVWPTEGNLKFISTHINNNKKHGLTSIGCGSGLFEWLFQKVTDIPVVGIEIEHSWWNTKFAKNKYIPLKFVEMPPKPDDLNPKYCLLFCYFNNESAFQEYIKNYKGDLVIIIGPGKDRGSFSNPEPFNPNFGDNNWNMIDSQEIKTTGDFIAIWKLIQ